jgi:hypothetical protein
MLAPSLSFALACLMFGLCAGFGWGIGTFVAGRITSRV